MTTIRIKRFVTEHAADFMTILEEDFLLLTLFGKIQGHGRKFLDRFKSYFGSQNIITIIK